MIRRLGQILGNTLRQSRKITMCALVLLCSKDAFSVGLGELSHKNYLGQNLEAQIDLIAADGIPFDNILVERVSGPEAERVGVELVYTGNTYEIEPVANKNRLSHILLRSNEPIFEPYVNILIKLSWPTGSVFREYALLFDAPPVPKLRSNFNAEASGRSNGSNANSLSKNNDIAADSYVVQYGDTLSRIASRLSRPNGITQGAAIQSIYERNPHAFQNGDINRLKAGARLNLQYSLAAPSISDGQSGSRSTIDVDVDSNAQQSKSATVGTATDDSGASTEGRLTLSEPVSGNKSSTYSQPEIQERIDGTQEMIDLLVKENQELRERIENIESSEYLNTLTQLVAMQRKQIEGLREEFQGRSQPSALTTDYSDTGSVEADVPTKKQAMAIEQALVGNFWTFLILVCLLMIAIAALLAFLVIRFGRNNAERNAQRAIYSAVTQEHQEDRERVPPSKNNGVSQEKNHSRPDTQSAYSTLSERLEEAKAPKVKPGDEVVKERIRVKTEEYNTSVSSHAPSRIDDVEIDVLVGMDDEVNELLSMAKIYCSAGKYSEARAIIEAQGDSETDSRLTDALTQIDEMEKSSGL